MSDVLDAHELCSIVVRDHAIRPSIKDESRIEVSALRSISRTVVLRSTAAFEVLLLLEKLRSLDFPVKAALHVPKLDKPDKGRVATDTKGIRDSRNSPVIDCALRSRRHRMQHSLDFVRRHQKGPCECITPIFNLLGARLTGC